MREVELDRYALQHGRDESSVHVYTARPLPKQHPDPILREIHCKSLSGVLQQYYKFYSLSTGISCTSSNKYGLHSRSRDHIDRTTFIGPNSSVSILDCLIVSLHWLDV